MEFIMNLRKNNLATYIILMRFVLIGITIAITIAIAIGFAINTNHYENNSQVSNKDTLKYSKDVDTLNDGKCRFAIYQTDEEQKISHLPNCRGCK